MGTALSLWGYDISGESAVLSIGAYVVISVLAIYLGPKLSVPWKKDKTDGKKFAVLEDSEFDKLLERRAKVRSSIIQVVGGIVAVAAFITSIQQIRSSDDAFNQKKADLFAKAVKGLLAKESKDASPAEAIHILSYIARSDRSYHRPVFDTLASYITQTSEAICRDGKYREAGFRRDQAIQLAMRTIGERRIDDDPTGKRFNLEYGCFVGLDLHDEWGVVKGLSRTRLSSSKMLRVDLVKAELQGAELMGIEASDFINPGWSIEIGRRLHKGAEGDPRKGTDDGDERRRYVAHFIDANLTGANFTGAGLQGADFSGAYLKGAIFERAAISRASFKGAEELTAEQLKDACVGHGSMTEDELKLEQPYFSPGLRAELRKHPALKDGFPKCR